MESSKPTKAIIALIVVVLLATAATAVIVMTSNKAETDFAANTETASDLPTEAPMSGNQGEGSVAADDFEDGTYSATGAYMTPGGREEIKIEVTLEDGIIKDANVTEQGMTGEAQQYQAQFVSSYKSQVVGKKINEVSLDRVAGSSLTSNGFNNALDNIEKQAAI